jgi:hypothetical protein
MPGLVCPILLVSGFSVSTSETRLSLNQRIFFVVFLLLSLSLSLSVCLLSSMDDEARRGRWRRTTSPFPISYLVLLCPSCVLSFFLPCRISLLSLSLSLLFVPPCLCYFLPLPFSFVVVSSSSSSVLSWSFAMCASCLVLVVVCVFLVLVSCSCLVLEP